MKRQGSEVRDQGAAKNSSKQESGIRGQSLAPEPWPQNLTIFNKGGK